MTDLNFLIKDMEDEKIARYFGIPIDYVTEARKMGAKTFQEVYDYVMGRYS